MGADTEGMHDGVATGIGMVDKEVCARQMILAVKHFSDARSDEGRKRWAQSDFPGWNDVMPIATDVVVHASGR